LQGLACAFVLHIAGVEGGSGLEQQYMYFFFAYGPVLYHPGHNYKLSFVYFHGPVAEFHFQPAFYHHEHLVFMLVVVPNELAFELYGLYVLAVEFAYDTRVPIIGKEA
jgi:hypothetical protein